MTNTFSDLRPLCGDCRTGVHRLCSRSAYDAKAQRLVACQCGCPESREEEPRR